MADSSQHSEDESIKPVSSLRSRFENLGLQQSPGKLRADPPPLRAPTPERHLPGSSPASTRPPSPLAAAQHDGAGGPKDDQTDAARRDGSSKKPPPPAPQPRRQQPPGTPRQRPVSMLPAVSLAETPRIDVTSPKSPPSAIVSKKVAPPPPAARRSASPSPDRQTVPAAANTGSQPVSLERDGSGHRSTDSLALPLDQQTKLPAAEAAKQKQPPPPPPAKRGVRASIPGQTPVVSDRYQTVNISHDASPARAGPQRSRAASDQSPRQAPVAAQNDSSKRLLKHDQSPSPYPYEPVPSSARAPPIPSPSTRPVPGRTSDVEELKPSLPPRRDANGRGQAAQASALDMGFSRAGQFAHRSTNSSSAASSSPRGVSPARQSAVPSRTHTPNVAYTGHEKVAQSASPNFTSSPDASRVNRRVPFSHNSCQSIPLGFDARIIDVCGGLVCAVGPVIRVWDSTTGRILLSMSLGEQVKATAVAFKPCRKTADDGTTLWVGTDWGELMEIDIASKRVVKTNATAHARHEVLRILRHGSELWTIDDEGKLWAWPVDERGGDSWPNLDAGIQNARITRRPNATLVIGGTLWVANGKEVRVYEPSSNPDKAAMLHTQQPLMQPGAGDITSIATLPSYGQVYMGHADGRVSVYSRDAPFDCIALLSVSSSRIYCMLGVDNYLWAAFGSGNIFVFDPSTTPWTIKKEWRASSGPVLRMMTDPNSLWKTDNLQVVTLGTDSEVCMWDGLLELDWLDEYMTEHQSDFCQYRDISALVMSWNAGAAKPSDLKYDAEDARFFQDFLRHDKTPDIVVFGLQELVDLEDKKLTAKTLFKGRHKDASGQEHLSTVYRAWRDYLTWCLDDCTSASDGYSMLHTASLVGLFTCVFVKAHLRTRIRSLNAAEVKTGMGGLHGNKGALLVRFVLDDSSLCFVNCHLAAGQTHTNHRNNDVTSILESEALPVVRMGNGPREVLAAGGDGSMVLDHEICILNGDLNYRIDTMPRESVISAVRGNNLKKLLDRDQLLLQHRRNPAFRLRAFTEAPIDFAPTYKYDVGSDDYDTGEKRRVPAWCDRILWRGHGQVEQQTYQRHDGLRASDHRPVSSRLRLRIKTMEPSARSRIWQKGEGECEKRKAQVRTDSQ